ncbi:hypothetical protein [Dongshaea marina]|uniref:hypothetical protein n=1 Tax=Dongshaea marina TaxID=2047966 RepID=UPI000D3E5186|nr:hypothetical protein [Dongshaea marina]
MKNLKSIICVAAILSSTGVVSCYAQSAEINSLKIVNDTNNVMYDVQLLSCVNMKQCVSSDNYKKIGDIESSSYRLVKEPIDSHYGILVYKQNPDSGQTYKSSFILNNNKSIVNVSEHLINGQYIPYVKQEINSPFYASKSSYAAEKNNLKGTQTITLSSGEATELGGFTCAPFSTDYLTVYSSDEFPLELQLDGGIYRLYINQIH